MCIHPQRFLLFKSPAFEATSARAEAAEARSSFPKPKELPPRLREAAMDMIWGIVSKDLLEEGKWTTTHWLGGL